MIGSGKVIGLILIVAGTVILLGMTLLLWSGVASGELNLSGAIMGGLMFGVLPFLLLSGAGTYLFIKGRAEAQDIASIRKKERLLGLIQSQGKAQLNTIMLELQWTRDEVKQAIYELVQQDLFTGYIDWSTNTFYSQEASQMGSNTCPNCGGTRALVGQGIVKCQFCGVELFIPVMSDE